MKSQKIGIKISARVSLLILPLILFNSLLHGQNKQDTESRPATDNQLLNNTVENNPAECIDKIIDAIHRNHRDPSLINKTLLLRVAYFLKSGLDINQFSSKGELALVEAS